MCGSRYTCVRLMAVPTVGERVENPFILPTVHTGFIAVVLLFVPVPFPPTNPHVSRYRVTLCRALQSSQQHNAITPGALPHCAESLNNKKPIIYQRLPQIESTPSHVMLRLRLDPTSRGCSRWRC